MGAEAWTKVIVMPLVEATRAADSEGLIAA
jgi:hypothetical protein